MTEAAQRLGMRWEEMQEALNRALGSTRLDDFFRNLAAVTEALPVTRPPRDATVHPETVEVTTQIFDPAVVSEADAVSFLDQLSRLEFNVFVLIVALVTFWVCGGGAALPWLDATFGRLVAAVEAIRATREALQRRSFE